MRTGEARGRLRCCALFSVAAALAACDEPKGSPAGATASSAPAAPSASAVMPSSSAVAEPPVARPPAITVDDQGATVDGTAFTGAPSEWQGRVAAALALNPKVAGEAVVVSAMRDAKAPKVEAIVAALAAAKAKSVVVRTPTRDKTTGELELLLHSGRLATECSAVAMIEKDGAVAVWAKGGGGAQRFTRGMAGPDLSSSTEALRKRAAACDSQVWFAGAAESVTWGLVFDLATRARGGGDAGAPLKPPHTVFLTQTPVAGKPVTEE